MARPCVHGDVCRAYIREKCCILRGTCPKCEYYEPVYTKPGVSDVDASSFRYCPVVEGIVHEMHRRV